MFGFLRMAVCVAIAAFATTALAQNYPSWPRQADRSGSGRRRNRRYGPHDRPAPAGDCGAKRSWSKIDPGGNTGVGAQAVERSPADGLTLLVSPDSTFTANPALFSKLIYDPDGFTPISVLCRGTPSADRPSVAAGEVGVGTVAYAKANPGKLSYGSFGTGTYAHLSMEDLKQRTGMDMQHVPYRGAAPALNGLLGNEVSVMLLNLSSVEAAC